MRVAICSLAISTPIVHVRYTVLSKPITCVMPLCPDLWMDCSIWFCYAANMWIYWKVIGKRYAFTVKKFLWENFYQKSIFRSKRTFWEIYHFSLVSLEWQIMDFCRANSSIFFFKFWTQSNDIFSFHDNYTFSGLRNSCRFFFLNFPTSISLWLRKFFHLLEGI